MKDDPENHLHYDQAYREYVESVVRPTTSHISLCRNASGASGESRLFQSIRWPGYVGSKYRSAPIRILCVAQVHHGPELLRTARSIEAILLQIASAGAKRLLLMEMHDAYERVMPYWGPWKDFYKILSRVDDCFTPAHVAYTNIAKCWQDPAVGKCEKPMRACLSEYPLEKLALAINAQAILVMSATGTLNRIGMRSQSIQLFNFPGRASNEELSKVGDELARLKGH